MPITGAVVIQKMIRYLQSQGFKEGDTVDVETIEKAIKSLGYYDQRTIRKYLQIFLSSDYVKKEPVYEEIAEDSLNFFTGVEPKIIGEKYVLRNLP